MKSVFQDTCISVSRHMASVCCVKLSGLTLGVMSLETLISVSSHLLLVKVYDDGISVLGLGFESVYFLSVFLYPNTQGSVFPV